MLVEVLMHRIFQSSIDCISCASKSDALRDAMQGATALDLPCSAYLSTPDQARGQARLISHYPSAWTIHCLQGCYDRDAPVIIQTLGHLKPLKWGLGIESFARLNSHQLFDEAARFEIRYGFTIPIHSSSVLAAAVTFATDKRPPQFERTIAEQARVLQLTAMHFHTRSERRIDSNRPVL